jgi:hypothetical protein
MPPDAENGVLEAAADAKHRRETERHESPQRVESRPRVAERAHAAGGTVRLIRSHSALARRSRPCVL